MQKETEYCNLFVSKSLPVIIKADDNFLIFN